MNENEIICPVMKNPVNINKAVAAGLTAEHEGKIFYFCCPGCQPKFAKDPEKYTANLPSEDLSSSEQGCSCC